MGKIPMTYRGAMARKLSWSGVCRQSSWLCDKVLPQGAWVLDLGCGTGNLITLPFGAAGLSKQIRSSSPDLCRALFHGFRHLTVQPNVPFKICRFPIRLNSIEQQVLTKTHVVKHSSAASCPTRMLHEKDAVYVVFIPKFLIARRSRQGFKFRQRLQSADGFRRFTCQIPIRITLFQGQ